MATVDIYVDTDLGTDNTDAGRGDTNGSSAYATLDYAVSQRAEDLTTAGDIHHYHYNGTTAETDAGIVVDWSSYTTDADNYIIVECDEDPHDGTRGSGTTIGVTSAYDNVFEEIPSYTQIIGLSIDGNSEVGGVGVRGASGATGIVFDRCLFYDWTDAAVDIQSGRSITIRNSAFYGCNIGIETNGTGIAQNVTILNCTTGIKVGGYDTQTDTNVYIGGATTSWDIDATASHTVTTSASSDGDESTATVAMSTSSGAYFTNVTAGSEDAHIGLDSDLIGGGTDLSATFTTDIDGDTRANWDIGADEYAAAGGLSGESTDGFDVGESVSAAVSANASASDGASIGDALSVVAALSAATSDGMAIGDEPLGTVSIVVSASDGIVLGDAVSGLISLQCLASDGITVGESTDTTANLVAAAADGVTMGEAVAVISALLADVADGLTLSDAASERSSVASGVVSVTITGSGPSITISATAPSIAISGARPDITITST